MSYGLTQRFKVTFKKDFALYKAGETTSVAFPIAMMHVRNGVAEASVELIEYAKSVGVKIRKRNAHK